MHAVTVLKKWFHSPEHITNPYPTLEEKRQLMMEAGITNTQLTNWFTNARKRIWKPLMSQGGQEQRKEKRFPSPLSKHA